VIGLSGCATDPKDTPESAAYYLLFDCNQLAEHARQVSVTAAELAGFGPHHCVATPNVVIFWPAAFARNVEEAQRLKNEFEAVRKASLQKSCSISFPTAAHDSFALGLLMLNGAVDDVAVRASGHGTPLQRHRRN
jgi:hypothetical protein